MTQAVNWKDRVKQAVSAGGTGALTLGAAASGFQAFAAGDNGLLYPYVIEDGTAWETGYGIYTHSGTSFARTLRYASSTGSALTVTTAAYVFVDVVAEFARSFNAAAHGMIPGGRLTLTTAVPVTLIDNVGISALIYTPFQSETLRLWDGNRWVPTVFAETAGPSIAASSANIMFDCFGYLNAGALALEYLAWANATVTVTIASPGVWTWTGHTMVNGSPFVPTTTGALPTGITAGSRYYVVNQATNTFQLSATFGGAAINTTGSQSGTHTGWFSGARQTAVTIQDGQYCKSGDKTRLLLGSFMSTATTTTEDSLLNRYVWNMYNRRSRQMRATSSSAHNVSGVAAREWNSGATTLRCNFVQGLVEDAVQLTGSALIETVNTASYAIASTALNGITPEANCASRANSSNNLTFSRSLIAHAVAYGRLGWNYSTVLEAEGASAIASFQSGENQTAVMA